MGPSDADDGLVCRAVRRRRGPAICFRCQARDNAGYLPSYSEAVQKKITEVGIQRISQDESRSFAYKRRPMIFRAFEEKED